MTDDAPAYGHVKISRKAYAKDRFWLEAREFSKWEAWEWMIQAAAWKPYVRPVGMTDVKLERGEFLASLRYMAEAWSWSIKKVRNFLEMVTDADQIRAQRETQAGTVYLLVNYEVYQSTPEDEGTANGKARAHRGHTVGTPRAQRKAVKASKAYKANGTSLEPKGRWKVVPKSWEGPKPNHQILANRLGLDVELEADKYRSHEYPRWRTDADRTFTTWLYKAVEFRERNGGRAPRTAQEANTRVVELRRKLDEIPLNGTDHD